MREPPFETATRAPGHLGATPWTLLERAVEHEALRACVEDLRDGRGSTIVVEGPAGIGKSSLLAVAADEGRARGVPVLAVTASEFETAVGFGLLHDLLAPALERARSHPQRDARTGDAIERSLAILGASDVQDRGAVARDTSRATMLILERALTALAVDSPLLLCVDDAQWADAASLRFLAFHARRSASVPVALVATLRFDAQGAEPAGSELLTSAGPGVLRPAPLSTDAVGVLIRERWFEDPPPDLVAACHEATGGNPYFLVELLAALRHSSASARDRSPERVLEVGGHALAPLILHRLKRLPTAALELARAASVIGDFGSPKEVSVLAGLDPGAAGDAAHRLADEALLASPEELEFTHPLLRSAIRSEVPVDRREELAIAAARALAAAGRTERAASYLVRLAPRGEPWIAEVLIDAGRAAGERGALDVSAALLRRALAEPPPDPGPALAAFGLAQMELGDEDAAATLRAALASAPTPAERARVARALALALIGQREPAEAIEVLEQTIDAIEDDEPGLAEEIEATLLFQSVFDPSRRERAFARLHARGKDRGASELAYRARLALLAFEAVSTCRPAAEAASQAERALAGGALLAEPATLHYMAVSMLARAGSRGLAGGHLDQRISEARLSGATSNLRGGLGQKAELALMRGNVIAAEIAARSTFEVAAEDEVGFPYFVWILTESLLAQGRIAEAEEELREANLLGALPELGPLGAIFYSRGRVRVASGSTLAGLEDLLDAGRLERDGGRINPAMLPWRAAAVPPLLELERVDEARALSRENLELARRFGAPHALGAAIRVAAATMQPHDRVPALREAVATLEPSFAKLELALAHADLGVALLDAGEERPAREALGTAVGLAHQLGAMGLAERANADLQRAGGRRRRPASGTGSLTPSEWRVARLAAEGRTNQQIAEELVVSLKTVETHLSRCYRKLEIAGRGELPMLGEPG